MADHAAAAGAGHRRRATLEQARSRRTREALVDAAGRLWAEHGVDAVTVAELCEDAGVSKGLFYFYFATKDDLLVEMLQTDAADVAAAIGGAIDTGATIDQVLERAVAVMARAAQRRPRHLLARAIAAWFAALGRDDAVRIGDTPLQAAFASAFAHGQAAGEVSSDLSADELGGLLEWALLRAALEWATGSARRPSLPKRLSSRAGLVLRGVRP